MSQRNRLLVGFDVVDPDRGGFRWPDRIGDRLPMGIEVLLDPTADTVRLRYDPDFRGQYHIQQNLRVHSRVNHDGRLDAVYTDGIRIVALGTHDDGRTGTAFPRSNQRADVALFTWSPWEQPIWRERRRPTFESMREAWGEIEPD